MKSTKIEWCDCTINPVVGCKNGCPYCYARRINDRFHIIPKWDEPQFFPDRLKQLESKKPMTIFLTSMSDFGLWNRTYAEAVFTAIRENPQHTYITLSKSPLGNIPDIIIKTKYMNLYCGYTVDKQSAIDKIEETNYGFRFLSIEPILEPIAIDFSKLKRVKQIIIGAETGNRKGKVIPKNEWIDNLVKQADEHGIKVFMKDSLISIVGEENMRRELIWRTK